MNILVYYPYNQRSVEQQSVMEMLTKKGIKVFMLTTCPEGYIHNYVRQFGVIASASPTKEGGLLNYFRQASYLRRFCKENKIDIIFAQQQATALPAMLASPFLKARIAYFRHNSDEDYQANPVKAKWMNWLLNHSMKRLVAPSQKVWQHWVQQEHVSPAKIIRINYGYKFDQYEKADPIKVSGIRSAYPCQLLIISIARFVPAKRHILMFRVIEAAVKAGIDCKLVCLGTGPDEASLKQWIIDNELTENIFIAGYRSNIFDYLAAADLCLHLSSTEASNSSIKEAALVACPCIVCKSVGDFEDYIENGQNGFLVSKEPKTEEVVPVIMTAAKNKEQLKEMGQKLKTTVLNEFDIKNVVPAYDKLIAGMN